MSNLTLLLIRLAFLAVLWLFVIAAVGVVRTDLFGSSRTGRQRRRQRKPPQAPLLQARSSIWVKGNMSEFSKRSRSRLLMALLSRSTCYRSSRPIPSA